MSNRIVVALGNPLRGDDGAGPAVLEALRESVRLPADVILYEGFRFGLMAFLFSGKYQQVIVIDAVDMKDLPGEWTRFYLNDFSFKLPDISTSHSLHHTTLIESAAFGEALNVSLPEIILYGIQPGYIDWATALSPAVCKAVLKVCESILVDLQNPVNHSLATTAGNKPINERI